MITLRRVNKINRIYLNKAKVETLLVYDSKCELIFVAILAKIEIAVDIPTYRSRNRREETTTTKLSNPRHTDE